MSKTSKHFFDSHSIHKSSNNLATDDRTTTSLSEEILLKFGIII